MTFRFHIFYDLYTSNSSTRKSLVKGAAVSGAVLYPQQMCLGRKQAQESVRFQDLFCFLILLWYKFQE